MESWRSTIEPMIDHLMDFVRRDDISHDGFFTASDLVNAYTATYAIISDPSLEYNEIEMMFQEEMRRMRDFCAQFKHVSLQHLLRQRDIHQLVMKWFSCFFHHLNLYYQRIMGDTVPMEHHFVAILCEQFLHPSRSAILQDLSHLWSAIREQQTSTQDTILDRILIMLRETDPEILPCIVSRFREDSQAYYVRLALQWQCLDRQSYQSLSLDLMEREHHLAVRIESDANGILPMLISTILLPRVDQVLEEGWLVGMRDRDEDKIQGCALFLHRVGEAATATWQTAYRNHLIDQLRSMTSDTISMETINALIEYRLHQEDVFQRLLQLPEDATREMIRILHMTFTEILGEETMRVWSRGLDSMIRRQRPFEEIRRHFLLFDFMSRSDVLLQGCRQLLARRLLDPQPDMELEIQVIEEIRQRTSLSHTMNMSAMIFDARNRFLETATLRMSLLSRNVWGIESTGNSCGYSYPRCIRDEMASMLASLQKDHMRIEPAMHHGHVILRGIFGSSRGFDFIMSPAQAIVLLYLSEQSCPLAQEELDQEFLCDPTLPRVLESLALARLVHYDQESEKWWIEHDYRSRSRLLIRVQPPKKSRPDKSIHMDQELVVDSKIIRILKTHRTLLHHDLLAEIGHPNLPLVKARIENLIDREYIARDPSNMILYHYLA